MALKRIVKQYTPTTKALDTVEEQAKTIQDLYDQVRNFYDWLNSPEFNSSLKGEKGDKGDPGIQGIQGIPGDKGQDGLVGPQGPRGLQGEPGAKGDKGDRGENGLNGERGPAGPSGPRGLTGPAGADGAKGEKGDKGDLGNPFFLSGVFDSYAEMVEEAVRFDARFYLIASSNKENGDVYVYREKYDDFIFLNNVIYDLFFQLMQGPTGRNFIRLLKGEHCDNYGTITIDKKETIDDMGWLHTDFTLNYLKGNGIKSTQWNEDLADSHTSTLVITFDNGTTATIKVKNGKGIANIEKTGTNVLVDTYTITFSEGDPFSYNVINGKGIVKIEKTSTDALTDTYTITWNDNTTTTYQVTNGKGISNIQKTNTSGLTDTYTITYNDDSTTNYVVVNGKGIASISKTSTSGLIDTYTITYNDGEPTTFTVTNGRDGRDGIDGVGIVNIVKTGTQGYVDTYTILLTNGQTTTFTVTNGRVEFLMEEIYVGVGSTYSDVFIAVDKYENLESPSRFNITANNNKIIVIYPTTNTYVGVPKMNGIDIPMITSTFTDDNVQYNVLTSINSYNDNLIITI